MDDAKINNTYLEHINNLDNISSYFGTWINDIDNLRDKFLNAEPFENIVIDNFLDEKVANELHDTFPSNYDDWYKYENPIEVKYAYDNIDKVDDKIKNYFYYLSSTKAVDIFKKLTNIHDLEYDEYLHGAGLHCHPKHGRLNIHLDYEKHPLSGKERRLNIIYFLSKDWKSEWNGQNELWDKNSEKCVKKTEVVFNRAIIFKTNDITWHGLPDKILCPENEHRKSLAFYYVSPLNVIKSNPTKTYRTKAHYILNNKNEKNENNNKLRELCKIRQHRRITQEDMNTYCPNWNKEL